ncbi:succinate dehydrogenase, hydrophobic membrane anchor protein [Paracoccus sp. PS-1]|uniref:succinate dehydrogenase, hydrophobic membrane anchor protein n=1 Tax=unclassified Paracoccus (in: a-proteobacteria) TaxID=2688777 RepID=UPI00048B641A|nr:MULTISPECIES: succinate dehydrogenase, hydrophobic membrane anchor protein [unclassified Paracoccus (in: a-proteobacteria)]MDQ7260428.1 succinate dehydrogenase, hydrophobic membrane anchor protein [Paracoccus sp. PS1]UFM66337.1 succinate dehydrogenase, hydrophobic membrane anchor protein [Paracoccus sp. MA]
MRYITPRKAAEGLGSAHEGTQHHWAMTVSAVALTVLTPLFMIVIARAIGLPHEQFLAYFGRPFPALITALFVIVGMVHFIKGTRIMIDDYFQGGTRKAAIIFSVIFGWAVIAAAVYALARMGLGAIVVV